MTVNRFSGLFRKHTPEVGYIKNLSYVSWFDCVVQPNTKILVLHNNFTFGLFFGQRQKMPIVIMIHNMKVRR